MEKQWFALVVSTQFDSRKELIRLLDSLSISVFCASTVREAKELLSHQGVEFIFCERDLPDGSYKELLPAKRSGRQMPSFVVITHSDEWEDYLEAIQLGTFDVLNLPIQPTDVELVVIRGIHGQEQRASYTMTT